MWIVSEETLLQAVEAKRRYGTNADAARVLGWSPTTLRDRLAIAARKGLGDGLVALPPEGHDVLRATTLYKDGTPILQWQRTAPAAEREALQAAVEETFDRYKGTAKRVPGPKVVNRDLLTVYQIVDLHLGLYSWKQETGMDFDVGIATRLYKEAITELVDETPASETAVLLNLGDYFHSDSNDNRTRRGGNLLDVDTRYARVLEAGVELLIYTVELLLRKHRRVEVRNLPGNHDEIGALILTIALANFFHREKRVKVDRSPDPFWVYQFGKVMLAATHGDEAKPNQMSGWMAARFPEMWGATKYRYAYLGHIHQMSKGREQGGAVWETFDTLTAKDAWNHGMGFVSNRTMVAITHHKHKGEKYRNTNNVYGADQ